MRTLQSRYNLPSLSDDAGEHWNPLQHSIHWNDFPGCAWIKTKIELFKLCKYYSTRKGTAPFTPQPCVLNIWFTHFSQSCLWLWWGVPAQNRACFLWLFLVIESLSEMNRVWTGTLQASRALAECEFLTSKIPGAGSNSLSPSSPVIQHHHGLSKSESVG